MTKKQKSNWMSIKELGKPNYNKREKRAYRLQRIQKKRDTGKWLLRDHIPFSFWIRRNALMLVKFMQEGTYYPTYKGYMHLPTYVISWCWKGYLNCIVVKLPNRWLMKMNRERKSVGSKRYIKYKRDGITLQSNQIICEEWVERPGITSYIKNK